MDKNEALIKDLKKTEVTNVIIWKTKSVFERNDGAESCKRTKRKSAIHQMIENRKTQTIEKISNGDRSRV